LAVRTPAGALDRAAARLLPGAAPAGYGWGKPGAGNPSRIKVRVPGRPEVSGRGVEPALPGAPSGPAQAYQGRARGSRVRGASRVTRSQQGQGTAQGPGAVTVAERLHVAYGADGGHDPAATLPTLATVRAVKRAWRTGGTPSSSQLNPDDYAPAA